jgi:hypothetical protein
MQDFQGYSPVMEIDTDRKSFAVYLDTETYLSEDWLIAAAVRYEDYDDFGSTIIAKLSTHLTLTIISHCVVLLQQVTEHQVCNSPILPNALFH